MNQNVIIDTNVFIAASFNQRSSARKIIDAVRREELHLVWDDKTKQETEKLLNQIPPINWSDYSELFKQERKHNTAIRSDRYTEAIKDPEDRKFAALSKSSGAPIVTNDSDLLDTKYLTGLKIYTPKEFVDKYL